MVTETMGKNEIPRGEDKTWARATEMNERSRQIKPRRVDRQVANGRAQGHTSRKENVSRKKHLN